MRPILLVLAALAASPSLAGQSGQPDYWPTCDSPQQLAPLQLIGGGSDMVWNGHEFAAVWIAGGYEVWFQRLFADGTPGEDPKRIPTVRQTTGQPRLVWNGQGYGVVWVEANSGEQWEPMFVLVDPEGNPATTPVQLSEGVADQTTDPTIAWSGHMFAVAWGDDLPYRIRMRMVDADGQPQGTHFMPGDCGLECSLQLNPSVAWSSAGRGFVVVWDEDCQGCGLTGTRVDENGASGSRHRYVGGASPHLADSGGNVGMLYWNGGSWMFVNVRPDATGIVGTPEQIAAAAYYWQPVVLNWTGAEYGCFWSDSGGSWFQRIASSGVKVDVARPISYGVDVSTGGFGAHGYLLAVTGPQALPWGCATPQTPLCPESVDAYSVSGTSATISWLPVPDGQTDIAYYQVYRNDQLVGRTAYPWFNDVGLSEGMEYDYDIRTVNAGQLVSAPCPTSNVTVTTSNQLQLQVERDGSDIDLTWAGQSTAVYRVMRGTSPRSMTEIKRTPDAQATDLGAATGSVCYFYSIDPPS